MDERTARLLSIYEQMKSEPVDVEKLYNEAMDARWNTVAFSDRPQHVKIRAEWKPSLLWGNMSPQEIATSTDAEIIRRRRNNKPAR